MLSDVFSKPERLLASVAGLLIFTLNEARMFYTLPRSPDSGQGQVYGVWLQFLGAAEPAYLSLFDVMVRWGLAGLTVVLCAWAVAETIPRQKVPVK